MARVLGLNSLSGLISMFLPSSVSYCKLKIFLVFLVTEIDEENSIKDEVDESNPLVSCIICGKIFKGPIQLKIHLWRHQNIYDPPKRGRKKGDTTSAWYEKKIWSCKHCTGEFALLEGLEKLIEHRKEIHKEVSLLECPNCEEKDFQNKTEMIKHLMTHNKEKPHCSLCQKYFFNNNKLRRHIVEVHEGRKNHMCNQCGKCFARPDKLRDHVKSHINGFKKKRNVKEEVEEEEDEEEDDQDEMEESDKEDDDFHFVGRDEDNILKGEYEIMTFKR